MPFRRWPRALLVAEFSAGPLFSCQPTEICNLSFLPSRCGTASREAACMLKTLPDPRRPGLLAVDVFSTHSWSLRMTMADSVLYPLPLSSICRGTTRPTPAARVLLVAYATPSAATAIMKTCIQLGYTPLFEKIGIHEYCRSPAAGHFRARHLQ